MKRTISILIALVLVFSLSVTAFAAEEIVSAVDANGNDVTESVKLAGPDALSEDDLAAYNAALATAVSGFEAGVKSGAIKVADGCTAVPADVVFLSLGDAEAPVTIEMTKPESFVGLLGSADGAWSAIDCEEEGDNIRFAVDNSMPIMLVSQSEPAPAPSAAPQPVNPSAENNAAPKLAEATDSEGEDANAAAGVSVVSYKDRDELNNVFRDVFALAYDELAEGFDEILANNEQLKAAAGENNVAVSDAFFITAEDVSKVNYPVDVEIELAKFGAENPDQFVALMQYVDGQWQFVDSSAADGVVTASINEIGPFAVVVVAAE